MNFQFRSFVKKIYIWVDDTHRIILIEYDISTHFGWLDIVLLQHIA